MQKLGQKPLTKPCKQQGQTLLTVIRIGQDLNLGCWSSLQYTTLNEPP